MNGNLLRRWYKPEKERQVQQKNLHRGAVWGVFLPLHLEHRDPLQHPPMTLIRNKINLHSAVSFI